MGAVIFFVLTVAVLLLCTPRGERALGLGAMAGVGIAIWIAVRISLHSVLAGMLGTLVELASEHWADLLMVFAAAVVLVVPVFMIYVAVGDQLEKRAATSRERERLSRRGLGFILRSEQPWIWAIDDRRSNRTTWHSRKKK